MFKPLNSYSAQNENGVVVELDKGVVRYFYNGHVLELGAQLCSPPSPRYDALFTVYFPTQLKWQVPHRGEIIPSETSQLIEKQLVEAIHALDCEVNFTIPVNG